MCREERVHCKKTSVFVGFPRHTVIGFLKMGKPSCMGMGTFCPVSIAFLFDHPARKQVLALLFWNSVLYSNDGDQVFPEY
jgi:hypothetical protein